MSLRPGYLAAALWRVLRLLPVVIAGGLYPTGTVPGQGGLSAGGRLCWCG